jgi:nitrite reductase/ring-hydroxylating ferredoxin subunit
MGADESRPVFTCPWHGWAFDLVSGYAVFEGPEKKGARQRVPTYPATISEGRVLIEVGSRPVRNAIDQTR